MNSKKIINNDEQHRLSEAPPEPIANTHAETQYDAQHTEKSENERESETEIITRIESEFDQQEPDDTYYQDTLYDYFHTSSIPGIELSNLMCRKYSCRAELNVNELESKDLLLSQLGTPPFDKGGFYYSNEMGDLFILFIQHNE